MMHVYCSDYAWILRRLWGDYDRFTLNICVCAWIVQGLRRDYTCLGLCMGYVTIMQGLCKDGWILAGLCKDSAWTGLCRVYVKMIQGLYSQNTPETRAY